MAKRKIDAKKLGLKRLGKSQRAQRMLTEGQIYGSANESILKT